METKNIQNQICSILANFGWGGYLGICILLSGCAHFGSNQMVFCEPICDPEDQSNVSVVQSPVRQVAFDEEIDASSEEIPPPHDNENLLRDPPEPLPDFQKVPAPPVDPQPETISVEEPFVIDLATTIKLGGGTALEVQIARGKGVSSSGELE